MPVLAESGASLEQLEAARSYVEQLVGRPLRPAERIIDVLTLDAGLARAKADLHRAIRAEQRRAVRRYMNGTGRLRLELTAAMLAPLARLYRLGKREAAAELARAGVTVARHYAEDVPVDLAPVAVALRRRLHELTVKVSNAYVETNVGEVAASTVARAMIQQLGALGIASDTISGVLMAGMSVPFSAAADNVGGWEYSAVLDGGTCENCGPLDGTTYETIDELFADLPDFGPNPGCDGGDRCRCRAVPLGPNTTDSGE